MGNLNIFWCFGRVLEPAGLSKDTEVEKLYVPNACSVDWTSEDSNVALICLSLAYILCPKRPCGDKLIARTRQAREHTAG